MLTSAPRGTYDALPGQVEKFHYIENVFRQVAEAFGYREIRTPVFEHTELFERGVGDTTDIVKKEMYTFTDKGGRSLTLRPEGTAPVARAFVEHKLYAEALPAKFYYCAVPIFRYERPQAGRYRQHHQMGVEIFGSNDPKVDAEVIALLYTFYRKLGLSHLRAEINSVGCPECRTVHRQKLHQFLAERRNQLCEICLERYERNPMRIFDCKREGCQEVMADAPTVVEFLCENCADHYRKVKHYLGLLDISFAENPRLVRGLDYYTNTAFELIDLNLEGAEKVIGAGGRYNGLVEEIGGPSVPGIGFGTGLERVAMACESEGLQLPVSSYCDLYVVTLGEAAADRGLQLAHQARQQGIKADIDYMERSMRSQMKHANRLGAKYVLIIGDNELQANSAPLRNMQTGEQQNISLDGAIERIAELISE